MKPNTHIYKGKLDKYKGLPCYIESEGVSNRPERRRVDAVFYIDGEYHGTAHTYMIHLTPIELTNNKDYTHVLYRGET